MKTYCIHPNSHRIDKTNFPTKDEAISRALECARILNRGISVYEVDEPGTDTQAKDWPKVVSPFKHIAFVLPDGDVQKGEHPAIELMEKDPEGTQLKMYPYALGSLSSLVKTLDFVARNPVLDTKTSKELFSLADAVQNRVFESQATVANKISKSEASVAGFIAAFKPGTLFKATASNTTIKILAVNAEKDTVSFDCDGISKLQTKTSALAKILLTGGYEIEAPANTPPPSQGYNNMNPHLNPVVNMPKDDAKVLEEDNKEKTLSEKLMDNAPEDTNLIAYCMALCRNDIYAADELASAFLDAFSSKRNTMTSVAQLKAMTSYMGHSLPADWFVTAQKAALLQLSNKSQVDAAQPTEEVRRTVACAVKAARDKGVKVPALAKNVSARIANGETLDMQTLDKMRLYLSTAQDESSLEFHMWGGAPARNWVSKLFKA